MKKTFLLFTLLTAIVYSYAQVAINLTGSGPDASAILDVSSTTKGVLFPRMTTSQRLAISSPATGLLVFDETENHYYYYDGSAWVRFFDGALAINDLTDAVSDGKSIYLGSNSGTNDDGNNYNASLGYKSLYTNTSGSNNNSLGFKSMYLNTSGSSNVSIGSFSMYNNTTGNTNVCIGGNANYYNQTGSQNTIIGYNAGRGTPLQNLNGEVFIGFNAGYNETNDNRLYISNSNTSSPLIYGEFDNSLLRINGTLNINNAYSFPTADGTSGQMLQTDGSGNVTWNNYTPGASEINDLTDGKTGGQSVFLGSGAGNSDDGTDNKNTALGYQALYSNTTGASNVAIGYQAQYSNVSGATNVAVGNSALYSLTNQMYNVAVGDNALFSNNGYSNTAIGYYSLYSSTSGNENTAVGLGTLNANSTGSGNVAIGNMAGRSVSGSTNTIVGSYAGGNDTSHNLSGEVFIGYMTGINETNSNRLYIDNSNTSSPLIYGEFDNDLLRINGTLNINGAYSFPTADGNSGQLLMTNGGGSVSWDNLEINDLADGKTATRGNLFLGTDAGKNITSSADYNTAVGDSALMANTSGSRNTAIGYYSLKENTDGTDNTAVGVYALQSNTGNYNTGIGLEALQNNTGNSNTGIGYKALKYATGNNNVGIGDNALTSADFSSSGNVAMGSYALKSDETGSNCVAVGYQSMYSNTDGNGNVAVGASALNQTEDGNYNTAVGYDAGPLSAGSGFSYTGAFGYNAIPLASGRIKIGDNTYVNWIGGNSAWQNTSDRRFKRDIKENVPGLDFILKLRPVTYRWDLHALEKHTGMPDSMLMVKDEKSAALLEKNLQKVHTGFIAQEVEQAAKETGFDFDGVHHPENEHDVYSLAYAEFVVPLVKAVQEQQKQITENDSLVMLNAQKISMLKEMLQKQNELINKALDNN